MITAEQKAKWVAALRSGDYKQGKYMLHNQHDNTFCCLGVLCEVMEFTKGSADSRGHYFQYVINGVTQSTGICNDVLGEQNDLLRNRVMRMNDPEDRSFDEIADVIEADLITHG